MEYKDLIYTIQEGRQCPWGYEVPVEIINGKDRSMITLHLPSKLTKKGIERDALRRVVKFYDDLYEVVKERVLPEVQEVYDKLVEKGYLTEDQTVEDLKVVK